MPSPKHLSRREFLVSSAIAGVATLAVPPFSGEAAQAAQTISRSAQVTRMGKFSYVGAHWQGDSTDRVEVRFSTPAGLSPWVRLTVSHDLDDAEGGSDVMRSALVRTNSTTYAEARIVSGRVSNLTLIPIDAGLIPALPPIAPTPAVPPIDGSVRLHAEDVGDTAASAASSVPIPAPVILTRALWGADESIRVGAPEFFPISKLIVHHSDTANNDPDPASTVRAIYQYHVQGNGWNDIGYNFLIDEAGQIYEGRWAREYADGETHDGEDTQGNGVVGAHALRVNYGSVGVCLLGTFTDQEPTTAAMSSLVALLSWKAGRHAIDANGASLFVFSDGSTSAFANISGHRDTYATSCPGNQAYGLVPGMRTRVAGKTSATTPGYWTATSGGTVSAFGLSQLYGSMAGQRLNAPVVSMAATTSGLGYWLLGADGGVFSFGDAQFFGSTGGMKLNKPVLAMTPASAGQGYWLAASDGGVFCFGDAQFFGSTGSIHLNQPIVGMAAHPSGQGYWLAASDGGVFCFGQTRFFGSVPGLNLSSYAGTKAIASTRSGNGYWILSSDGSITAFGDASYLGSQSVPPGTMVALGRHP